MRWAVNERRVEPRTIVAISLNLLPKVFLPMGSADLEFEGYDHVEQKRDAKKNCSFEYDHSRHGSSLSLSHTRALQKRLLESV